MNGDEACDTIDALACGVHLDVPESVYFARVPGVARKSTLDLVARSPARYRAWLDGSDRHETPSLALGKAIHMALLEPARFAATYVVEPGFGDLRAVAGRTTTEQGRKNKLRRDAWRAEHADAIVLHADDGASTLGIVRAITLREDGRELLRDGHAEATFKWIDDDTGLVCLARIDFWLPDIALPIDLKTCDDARESAFSRAIETYGYHRQAAHYLDGCRALGFDAREFIIIAAEKSPPFDFGIWQLDTAAVDEGRRQNRVAMRTMAQCVESDTYPGYATGIRTISRPAWATRSENT